MNSNSDAGVRLFTAAPTAAGFANSNGPPLAWDWTNGALYGVKSDGTVIPIGPLAWLRRGAGAPSNSDGSNGDYYFRSDGGVATHIYFKSAGSWAGII